MTTLSRVNDLEEEVFINLLFVFSHQYNITTCLVVKENIMTNLHALEFSKILS